MDNMNYVTTLAYVKATSAVENVKNRFNTAVSDFKNDERGVEGFVVAIILIAIAAALAIVFRDYLINFMNKLIEKINELFDGSENDISTDI